MNTQIYDFKVEFFLKVDRLECQAQASSQGGALQVQRVEEESCEGRNSSARDRRRVGDHRRYTVSDPVWRDGLGSTSDILYIHTGFMVVMPTLACRADLVGAVVENQQKERLRSNALFL